MHNKPLAAQGFKSYRAKGRYGWIMIGAIDTEAAKREAARSTSEQFSLQVWDDAKQCYIDA